MTESNLQTAARTLFNSITGLKVRPRFCRAEGPSGLHRSPQRGETVEFSEYRPYFPGAELRFLDWKLYARCDRLFVKSFCDERASRFLLIVDDSASMRYPFEGPSKLDLAAQLAMGLAYLAAQRQKDAVNLTLLSDLPADRSDEFVSFGSILMKLQSLLNPAAGSEESVGRSGKSSAPPLIAEKLSTLDLRRPTTVIFISDLYEQPMALQNISRRARRLGHEFWFLHVLSKDEIALPYENLRNFIDVETNSKLQLDPQAIRAHYSRALHEHISALRSLAAHGRYGFGVLGHDPAEILKHLLQD